MQVALRKTRETAIHGALLLCALLSIATTIGIVWVLFYESFAFFREVSLVEFLTGTTWSPLIGSPPRFGILPLVCGTLLIAGGALLIAVPIGLATAIYLSEYATPWFRGFAKPILEVLAGVPTVVYGYFALTFITPHVLRPILPQTEIFNAAAAAIVLGIMIVPTICSLCDDALRAVPRSLREGAYGVAATKLEVSTRIVLPAATSGVAAACLLGLARAIGETMAVTIAAGMTPKLTLNPFTSVQTLTSYMVQVSLGDAPHGTIEYRSLFAVGLVLFLITLAVNLIAQRIIKRFREVYE